MKCLVLGIQQKGYKNSWRDAMPGYVRENNGRVASFLRRIYTSYKMGHKQAYN